MMSQAIGMIETKGLVGAIESADAMIKAANVRLIKQEFIDGGIVTTIVQGDVGAVQAAVDAGREAAKRVGELLGAHVIPRPDESVYRMVEPLDYEEYQKQQNEQNQPVQPVLPVKEEKVKKTDS